jgi:hypothetical protein
LAQLEENTIAGTRERTMASSKTRVPLTFTS